MEKLYMNGIHAVAEQFDFAAAGAAVENIRQ
jgi:hypothetical protein